VTVIGDAPVAVIAPGLDVAVKVVTPVPAAPAVYVTVACAFPAAAETLVGVPGFAPIPTELLTPASEATP
jgi:hypothetical protein